MDSGTEQVNQEEQIVNWLSANAREAGPADATVPAQTAAGEA